jgi:hypothetical protein
MDIINTKSADAERIIKSFFKKRMVIIITAIIAIVIITVRNASPELGLRSIIILILIVAIIFGLTPNEILCNNIYKEIGLGCPARFVSIIISICLYILALSLEIPEMEMILKITIIMSIIIIIILIVLKILSYFS